MGRHHPPTTRNTCLQLVYNLTITKSFIQFFFLVLFRDAKKDKIKGTSLYNGYGLSQQSVMKKHVFFLLIICFLFNFTRIEVVFKKYTRVNKLKRNLN